MVLHDNLQYFVIKWSLIVVVDMREEGRQSVGTKLHNNYCICAVVGETNGLEWN